MTRLPYGYRWKNGKRVEACHFKTKVRYKTEQAAKSAAAALSKGMPRYYATYPCGGHWHLTTKSREARR